MTQTAKATQAHELESSPPDGLPNSEISGHIAELQRQIFDLHTAFDVARQFHEVWDINALLDGILLAAIEHLRVGAAAVTLTASGEPGNRPVSRSKGWEPDAGVDWTTPINSVVAARLQEYRRPLPIEALAIRAAANAKIIDAWRRAGCVLVIPIVRRESLCGVLYLSEKVDRGAFSSVDLGILDLLVDQFAVSIDNALLYDRERLASEQLLLTRQRLAAAEKLAALGQMAATIAHEVRNPIGIIRNHLELMRPELSDRHGARRSAEVISEELGRIESFVRNLLGAFHPDQSRPTTVALQPLLLDVAKFFSPRFQAQAIDFVSTVSSDTPKVYAEPNVLRQVFINICLNALDAMDKGGTLAVAATYDREWVHLSFSDTGMGIPRDLVDRLFDPFVTTKTEGEGSGLGLSICRNLLERFDAQINAANVPSPRHGAVFTVHLSRNDARTTSGKHVLPEILMERE